MPQMQHLSSLCSLNVRAVGFLFETIANKHKSDVECSEKSSVTFPSLYSGFSGTLFLLNMHILGETTRFWPEDSVINMNIPRFYS